MILCIVLVKPYLYCSISIDPNHPVIDLKTTHLAVAVIEASHRLAQHIKLFFELQFPDGIESVRDVFCHDFEDVFVSTEVGRFIF